MRSIEWCRINRQSRCRRETGDGSASHGACGSERKQHRILAQTSASPSQIAEITRTSVLETVKALGILVGLGATHFSLQEAERHYHDVTSDESSSPTMSLTPSLFDQMMHHSVP